MTATPITCRELQELAHRENDGLEVTLLWQPSTDGLKVRVRDQRNGASFELRPAAHRALDAFYHPYSYAACGGVRHEDGQLAA
jgi:hypothetical protein